MDYENCQIERSSVEFQYEKKREKKDCLIVSI